jgi:hypothetical protein
MVEAEQVHGAVSELEGEGEVTLSPVNWDSMDIEECFAKLEKAIVGYDDYINADEAHYAQSIEGLHRLVSRIQS